jgi:hypothetical protein
VSLSPNKVVLLLLCSLLWCSNAMAKNFYRYQSEEGRPVITQTLPPHAVHRGYEILNESGRVVKVVPRALTEEELAALSEVERSKQQQAEQAQRDKKLLTIFSSPKDAERARDRKLEALDVYINVTRGNILKLKGEFNDAQSRAAQKERAGQEVPEFLVQSMNSLGRQIQEAEESIVEKEQEKVVIRKEYQKDIDRLKLLVEARRKATSN